jgi:hypothetical protein
LAVVLVAAGLTTTSARMVIRLTATGRNGREEGTGRVLGPRNLAVVTEQGSEQPQAPRRRADRLFGAAAHAPAPRPERVRPEVPGSLRWAAALVGVEALATGVLALAWIWLILTSTPDRLAFAVAEVVIIALVTAGLAAAAVGLSRAAGWARGAVVAAQIFFGLSGFVAAFEADRPLIGVPILLVVAGVLYLLATPEARLAYFR